MYMLPDKGRQSGEEFLRRWGGQALGSAATLFPRSPGCLPASCSLTQTKELKALLLCPQTPAAS